MVLNRSIEWQELVGLTAEEEENQPRIEGLLEDLLRGMDSHDMRRLAAVCRSGSPEERYAAFRVVLQLVRRNDPRLRDSDRRRCLASAKKTAIEQFPLSALGLRAFGALRAMDREEAESLLVAKLKDGSTMTGRQARWLVLNLTSMGSRRTVAALQSAEDLPPEARAARDRFLKRLRRDNPKLR
jgi:hypothetical protein